MNAPIISEKDFPGELGKIYDFNWSKASDLYVHQPETNYGFGNAVLVNNKVCSDIKQKQMVYNNLDFTKAPPDSEEKRSAAISVFKKDGFDIAVATTHLDAFDYMDTDKESHNIRNQQLLQLVDDMKKYESSHICIITLDANMTSDRSQQLQEMVNNERWRIVVEQGIDLILVRTPPGVELLNTTQKILNKPRWQKQKKFYWFELSDHCRLDATIEFTRVQS